jgi:hypothetical protein
MGGPGPTIAGGKLSVGSGYIGELAGMPGATCCWFFRLNEYQTRCRHGNEWFAPRQSDHKLVVG